MESIALLPLIALTLLVGALLVFLFALSETLLKSSEMFLNRQQIPGETILNLIMALAVVMVLIGLILTIAGKANVSTEVFDYGPVIDFFILFMWLIGGSIVLLGSFAISWLLGGKGSLLDYLNLVSSQMLFWAIAYAITVGIFYLMLGWGGFFGLEDNTALRIPLITITFALQALVALYFLYILFLAMTKISPELGFYQTIASVGLPALVLLVFTFGPNVGVLLLNHWKPTA